VSCLHTLHIAGGEGVVDRTIYAPLLVFALSCRGYVYTLDIPLHDFDLHCCEVLIRNDKTLKRLWDPGPQTTQPFQHLRNAICAERILFLGRYDASYTTHDDTRLFIQQGEDTLPMPSNRQ
jgi:hypothetical protein